MKDKLVKQMTGFTQVANQVLNDKAISLKAKGVYAYIYSKPDGWDFAIRRIAQDHSDGVDSTAAAIRELEKAGYIKRSRMPSGRVIYHILVDPLISSRPHTEKPYQGEPHTEKPDTGFPTVGKSHSGKTRTISNKEGEAIKSINNKDINSLLKKSKKALTESGVI